MKRTISALTAMTAIASSLTSSAADFGGDVSFMREYTDVVVLSDPAGQAKVAVVPAWQGRVMTSTAAGEKGSSFGWVNRDLISTRKFEQHINVFGGEDRFWLGPEGGQFSIFFAKGAPFDLDHWFTPASIDTEPFSVVRKSAESVVCRRDIQLTNYSGTPFSLEVDREVKLVPAQTAMAKLGLKVPAGVKSVGFESINTVKNTGKEAWAKDTGLLSIWILGMFNASPEATIVVPFEKGTDRGEIVNDSYFGKVPTNRLVVKDGVLFFQADANYRSKIGLSPSRAKPLLGSYDAAGHTLTLVQYTFPKGASEYVNSMWELQKNPFAGDVVNSYNDGPSKPGAKQMGKFFELESSSPALALQPGAKATHTHQTIHLQGTEEQLDPIARAALGVGIAEIKTVFGKK